MRHPHTASSLVYIGVDPLIAGVALELQYRHLAEQRGAPPPSTGMDVDSNFDGESAVEGEIFDNDKGTQGGIKNFEDHLQRMAVNSLFYSNAVGEGAIS